MIVTTTPSIEGQEITGYLGIVSGQAILGANIFRDLFEGIRNVVGGRAGHYERELKIAREEAMEEMTVEAISSGANAIVGVDVDYELLSQSMLMVSATGTAVLLNSD